jgi:hypothetical protein
MLFPCQPSRLFEKISMYLVCCLQHMLAGAAAGITEHTAMYPVDTIKTRMQALSHPGQKVSNAARAFLFAQGFGATEVKVVLSALGGAVAATSLWYALRVLLQGCSCILGFLQRSVE